MIFFILQAVNFDKKSYICSSKLNGKRNKCCREIEIKEIIKY